MEAEYTKRELDTYFKDVHDKLDTIVTQTTRTNGRVNKLETWRAMIVGGLVLMSAIGIPLMLRNIEKIDDLSVDVIATKVKVDTLK